MLNDKIKNKEKSRTAPIGGLAVSMSEQQRRIENPNATKDE